MTRIVTGVRALDLILDGGRRIAIDSLAELVLADREWDRFPAYMRSLVGLVRAAGVSFLATSETAGGAITLNQVTITDAGLTVGDRLEGVTGRHAWSALRTQDPHTRTDSAPAS